MTIPGVEIGRRHFPARQAFMNGPTKGTDVFIPMEFLIGGTDYAGQGWRMLMECLSTGRAISLPAIGSISIKQSLRVTSAYARVRRQFGIPVGIMEGVAEPLGRMVKNAYMFEAARALTASMVDEGQQPGGDFGPAQIPHHRSHARKPGRCFRYPWRPRHPGRPLQLSVLAPIWRRRSPSRSKAPIS